MKAQRAVFERQGYSYAPLRGRLLERDLDLQRDGDAAAGVLRLDEPASMQAITSFSE